MGYFYSIRRRVYNQKQSAKSTTVRKCKNLLQCTTSLARKRDSCFLFVSFPTFRRIYVIRKQCPAAFAWRHPEFKVLIFNCGSKTFDQWFLFLLSLKRIVIFHRRSIEKHWVRELKTYNYSFCIFKYKMISTLNFIQHALWCV